MRAHQLTRLASRWVVGGLASLLLPSLASAQLVLSIDPPNPGPGDTIDIVLTGGQEGDYALVVAALDPGPTTFGIVGELQVGLDSLTIYPFGQFDSSGVLRFPCQLDCFAAEVDPFYAQALTVRLTPTGPIIPAKSNPLVLVIDDLAIEDCNGNGIDDDCDIESGFSMDCNENGVPDECDPDCDNDGIPDDCDDEVASYCAKNMDEDSCDDLVPRIVWIGNFSEPHFVLVDGGQFLEYADGSASFHAVIERIDDEDKSFVVDVLFTGRVEPGDPSHPPAGSPKLHGTCPKDTPSWSYYTDFSGTFMGLGDYAGAVYDVYLRGPAFQVGDGANLFNAQFGGAAWFTLKRARKPDSGYLPKSLDGDFNMDLERSCDCE